MSWLDAIRNRAQEAQAAPVQAKPRPTPRQPKREIKSAWFQTHAPRDGDCGGVEAVHYFVADGTVSICDELGKPTSKTVTLAENDDPRAIAARLGRAAWLASTAGSNFNRRLDYGPLGIA